MGAAGPALGVGLWWMSHFPWRGVGTRELDSQCGARPAGICPGQPGDHHLFPAGELRTLAALGGSVSFHTCPHTLVTHL